MYVSEDEIRTTQQITKSASSMRSGFSEMQGVLVEERATRTYVRKRGRDQNNAADHKISKHTAK